VGTFGVSLGTRDGRARDIGAVRPVSVLGLGLTVGFGFTNKDLGPLRELFLGERDGLVVGLLGGGLAALALFAADVTHGRGEEDIGERDLGPVRPRVLGTVARRYLLLIPIGILLQTLTVRMPWDWGVLQTLGMGGIDAVVFAGTSDVVALGVAALILATHYGPGNNAVHRSAVDCMPFLSLTLLGLVVGRPLAAGDRAGFRRRALVAAVTCLTLALGLRLAGIPFNKVTGTSSFIALAGGVGSTLMVALESFDASGLQAPRSLTLLGANALTAWVLQYVLVFYPVTYAVTPPDLSEAFNLGVVVVVTGLLTTLTLALARRGIRVPI